MASLWKHPSSPYWTACYTNQHGKQVKRSTKLTDKRKARIVAEEWEESERSAREKNFSIAKAQQVLSELTEKLTGDTLRSPSVKSFLAEWMETKRTKNAEGTADRYQRAVNLFIDHLGERATHPITSLSPSDFQRFLDSRMRSGYAPKTAILEIKTLSAAFNRATRQGLLLKNPALAVELPKIESSERNIFSDIQLKQLVASLNPQSEWFILVLLGYFTGARLKDCAQMKWENVDLFGQTLAYTQRKTGKRIVMPLHPVLFECLDQFNEYADAQEYETGAKSEFVCPDLASRTTGGKHGLSESFNRLLKRAGIDAQQVEGVGTRKFRKLTFHSLRHSFNSHMARKGVPQEIRMKLVGHTTAAMNARYTHHDDSQLQSAIKMLPNLGIETAED
jgi:integrase